MEIFIIFCNIFLVLFTLLGVAGIVLGGILKAMNHWKYLKTCENSFEGENSFSQSFFRFRFRESLELRQVCMPLFRPSLNETDSHEVWKLRKRIHRGLILFWGGLILLFLLNTGHGVLKNIIESNPGNIKVGVMDFSNKKYRKQITTPVKKEDLKRLNFPDGMQYERYDNGVIFQCANFEDGLKHGTHEVWYSNGVLKQSTEYQHGIKHGSSIEYYENGNICLDVNFSHSLWHGAYKLYYKNGSLYEESNWDNGYPHGDFTIYYKNGQPQIKGTFNKGEPVGEFEYYAKNGTRKNDH